MKNRGAFISLFAIIFIAFLTFKAAGQNTVTVGGEVAKSLTLDAGVIKNMKHVNVKGIAHADHKIHTYSGVPLSEIIKESGAIPDNQLKGKYLAKYILISAADGYQAVIALPEIDTAFTNNVIILADKEDNFALPVNAGPFQIVVPGDKKPARCVRQVVSINILSAKLN